MTISTNTSPIQPACGKILVVDDDPVTAGMLAFTLSEAGHHVLECHSGEAALKSLFTASETPPDLVILDIEMSTGIDGYATCRRLRANPATAELPVIFLSGHDELDDRLAAYDAGGTDFMAKPFVPDEVLRKTQIAIRHSRRQTEPKAPREASAAAMTAITSLGESGVTLHFSRAALGCRTLHALAEQAISAMASFGVECHIQIRLPDSTLTMTPKGAASPLEVSVMDKSLASGRLFSFHNRLVVNYDRVSMLVPNMPIADDALCGRIRDHIAMIAEAAELAVDNIQQRIEANRRASSLRQISEKGRTAVDALRENYRTLQVAARVELAHMTDAIEAMYPRLGLTDDQEYTLSNAVRSATEHVLSVFAQSTTLDLHFAEIVAGLTQAEALGIVTEEVAPSPDIEIW